MTWEALRNACLACTQCPLCQTRHNVVFGVGPEDAEVLFIGEGPGEQEDLKGEPFVGPAGRLLDEMLTIIDLSPGDMLHRKHRQMPPAATTATRFRWSRRLASAGCARRQSCCGQRSSFASGGSRR